MGYDWPRAGLVELASVDESEGYDVDQAVIAYEPGTAQFVLARASGCSCWDGEWEEEKFDSLPSLAASLVAREHRYTPSLKGSMQLIEQAIEKWPEVRKAHEQVPATRKRGGKKRG